MVATFSRLVRFRDPEGKVHYGEAGSDWQQDIHGQTIPTYSIDDPWAPDFPLTGVKAQVAKVARHGTVYLARANGQQILSPLESIPLMIGIGLNYKSHAEEANVRCSLSCYVKARY